MTMEEGDEYYSSEYHIQLLLNIYLLKREILPYWCYKEKISSINNSIIKEFDNISKEIIQKRIRKVILIMVSKKKKYKNKKYNEILNIKLNKKKGKIFKKESQKIINNFKEVINKLKKIKRKKIYLILKGEKKEKINIKIFNKIFLIKKNNKTIYYNNNHKYNSSDYNKKKEISNIIIKYKRKKKREKVIFKYPIEEKNIDKKSLILQENKNSLLKTADKKSKIFENQSILEIKTTEKSIFDFKELNTLNSFNEQKKRDCL